ncbi:hypothetical protein N9L19_01095 [bacterium]|nr:hypothetical protein [bacterium]
MDEIVPPPNLHLVRMEMYQKYACRREAAFVPMRVAPQELAIEYPRLIARGDALPADDPLSQPLAYNHPVVPAAREDGNAVARSSANRCVSGRRDAY